MVACHKGCARNREREDDRFSGPSVPCWGQLGFWVYKMRIGRRMNLGFLAIALWASVVGHISLLRLEQISASLNGDIPGSLESINTMDRLDRLAQVVRYYDKASTQSARTFALTQDKKWEERYEDVKPKLDDAIREVINRTTEEETRFLSEADKVRCTLVELEKTSIELVKKGKAAEAIKLLEGSEYRDRRKIYEGLLTDYVHGIQTKHDEALVRSTTKVSSAVKRMRDSIESSRRLVSVFAFTTLIIALSSGLLISRSISKPLARLRAAAAEIGKGRLDIEIEVESNDEIGLLAASFKGMTNDLKNTTTSIDNLNREISERKKAEESVRFACEEIEKANHELKEMQSQQVQNAKLASIGQLAAGVAHELNTPIGFIGYNFSTLRNYVMKMQELLQMHGELINDIETSEKSELLNKAGAIRDARNSMRIDFIIDDIARLFDDSREGLERVTNIVKSLRDFSRIDQLVDFHKYNINEGIKTTLVVARNEIESYADVEMKLSEVPSVICNAGQINQVIINLLINAAQAIRSQEKSDKGRIVIRTYTTDDNVVCEISDSGPGIEPDNLQHIFDPFFTTKPVGKGTGLGLSISYDIVVARHNGRLLVDSSVGEGTKFTMELPISGDKTDVQCEVENNGKESCAIRR